VIHFAYHTDDNGASVGVSEIMQSKTNSILVFQNQNTCFPLEFGQINTEMPKYRWNSGISKRKHPSPGGIWGVSELK
jgi:hypothetical protein